MNKTIKIYLQGKDDFSVLGCGYCFSIIEEQDEYCWRCGYYFDVEIDAQDSYEKLHEYMHNLDTNNKKTTAAEDIENHNKNPDLEDFH